MKIDWLIKSPASLFKLVVIVLVLFFVAIPLANLGIDHLRVVEAFNTDESDYAWPIIQCIQRGDFDLGRYDYGMLYYNICIWILRMLTQFLDLSDSLVMITTRLVSFSFLVLNALVMSKMAKRFFGIDSNWVFLLTFLGSTILTRYSIMLHPDSVQLFFISLSLYSLCYYLEYERIIWLVLASIFAGLTFAAKFAGIIILPGLFIVLLAVQWKKRHEDVRAIIPLTLLLLSLITFYLFDAGYVENQIKEQGSSRGLVLGLIEGIRWFCLIPFVLSILSLTRDQIRSSWFVSLFLKLSAFGMLVSYLFLFGFYMGSPQLVPNLSFIDGFIYITSEHTDGHWFRDESGLIGWLTLLIDNQVMRWPFIVLGVIGIGFSLQDSISSKRLLTVRNIPFIWILLFLFSIVTGVGSKFRHYLIPVLPAIFLYSCYAVHRLMQLFARQLNDKKEFVSWIVTSLLLLFTGIQTYNYKTTEVDFVTNSGRLKAGEWFNQYSGEARVVADKYVYVPALPNLHYSAYWGLLNVHFETENPDIVAIHEDIYNEFLDISRADEYLYGKEFFLERNKLYHDLLNDTHESYRKVADYGEVKIYLQRD